MNKIEKLIVERSIKNESPITGKPLKRNEQVQVVPIWIGNTEYMIKVPVKFIKF